MNYEWKRIELVSVKSDSDYAAYAATALRNDYRAFYCGISFPYQYIAKCTESALHSYVEEKMFVALARLADFIATTPATDAFDDEEAFQKDIDARRVPAPNERLDAIVREVFDQQIVREKEIGQRAWSDYLRRGADKAVKG